MDLNAILCENEATLARLYEIIGKGWCVFYPPISLSLSNVVGEPGGMTFLGLEN